MMAAPRYRQGVPIALDDFARVCGHFDGAAPGNNGYGCRHPASEDGACLLRACPLGAALNPETEPEDRAAMNRAWGLPDDAPVECSDGVWLLPHADGPAGG